MFDTKALARLTEKERTELRILEKWAELEPERLELEGSLIKFFEAAWPIFDPTPLRISWHHHVMAEHLEAVTAGEIRHCMILVPPRCSKSTLVNVVWPAWCWARRWKAPLSGPAARFMCLSYGHTLAHDIAITARRLVNSDWYRERWGDRVQINEDQGAIDHFTTSAGGARIATHMGGTLGRGGLRVIDDAMSREQAESDIERHKVIQAYDEGLATRDTDPATTAEVIIQQRLHEGDLAGHIFTKYPGRFTTVMLPMRFDERRCWYSTLKHPKILRDPRQVDGELLWPEQFPEHIVIEREQRLGEYACTPAESPILMADLSYKPISEVRVGDEVIGFTTDTEDGLKRRFLCKATVSKTFEYPKQNVVKVILDSGEEIRCTADHKWYAGKHGGFRGMRADGTPDIRNLYRKAQIGKDLMRIAPARLRKLSAEEQWDAAWLAGFFDGEGTVSNVYHRRQTRPGGGRYRPSAAISFIQATDRHPEICENLERILDRLGYDYYAFDRISQNEKWQDSRIYTLRGRNLARYQEFLHVLKVVKWRERFIEGALGSKFIMAQERVTYIKPDGEETVYALETTTGNYVVWGFASSNSASQYQQSPVPRGGGIIKRDWWKTWPDDAEGLADIRVAYSCPMCKWADYVEDEALEISCPQCGSTARQIFPYPPFSYHLVSIDTAYGEKDTNSYSAAVGFGVWHDKSGAPRVMMTDAWRGRPRLRGDPNAKELSHRMGLLECVYQIAQRRHSHTILIEQTIRGTDLYHELARITQEWPHQLEWTKPGQLSKAARLESCVNLFVNGLVWAPDLDWASNMVIPEVCTSPFSEFDDLTDCVSSGLRYLRENGMLQTDREYERMITAQRMFRGRSWDAAQEYGF